MCRRVSTLQMYYCNDFIEEMHCTIVEVVDQKKKKNDHMHDLESPFLLHWFKYMYFAVDF